MKYNSFLNKLLQKISLILFLVISFPTNAAMLYNGGFEFWSNQNYLSDYSAELPDGWIVDINWWSSNGIGLTKNDSYHSSEIYSARTGNYALFFFGTGHNTPISTKNYTLAEGTYTFSVYASSCGWAHTRITLFVEGDISKSQYYEFTSWAHSSDYNKYSITFTIEKECTVRFGINNEKPWDGNSTIAHFVVDDCELETSDGKIISSEYDVIVTDYPNYVFWVYSDGTADLVSCKSPGIDGEIIIPNSIDYEGKNYLVKQICEKAFNGCSNITKVSLPTKLEIIGNKAFEGCTSLKKVIVPNLVRLFGDNVFSCCSNLETVEIFSKTIPSFGESVFPDP